MISTYLIPTNIKSKLVTTHINSIIASVYSTFMPIMARESNHLIIFILALLRNTLSVPLIFQEVESARASM
jgi:hypothetical protein